MTETHVSTIQVLLTQLAAAATPITVTDEAAHTLQAVAVVRNRPYSPLAKMTAGSDSGLATLVRKHFATQPGGRQELEILPVARQQLIALATLTAAQADTLIEAVNSNYQTVLKDNVITMTQAEKPAAPSNQQMASKYDKYLNK